MSLSREWRQFKTVWSKVGKDVSAETFAKSDKELQAR
jgi:hypothetical protein